MPNWCTNDVSITFASKTEYDNFVAIAGVEKGTDAYLEYEAEEKGYGFFDKFMPTPPEMLEGQSWWDWRITNWGTKWNPNVCSFDLNPKDMSVTLSIDTAWAPPKEFFIFFTQLFISAMVKMTYLEEGMGFCGKALFANGLEVYDNYINDIPVEMYVAAGATLNEEGNIDWDAEQYYNLWEVIDNPEEFDKFYELATH